MKKKVTTGSQKIDKFIKYLWFIFGFSIILFCTDFLYVIVIKGVLFNEIVSVFAFILLGSILLGSLSFLLAIFLTLLKKYFGNKKLTFVNLLLIFLTLPVLPVYLFISKLLNKDEQIAKRIVGGTILLVFLLPFWILGYTVLYYVSTDELLLGTRYQVGTLADSDSMIPTLKPGTIDKYYPYKNFKYKLNPKWAYKLNRGDIIAFRNQTTQDYLTKQNITSYSRFVKRIIAIEGDEIELRMGIVLLNGKPLIEPYTLEPNSTFPLTNEYNWAKSEDLSGLFLKECNKIKVPKNRLFVLGDNRKNSSDSRVFGFVDINDVVGYLPFEEQKIPFKEGVNTINFSEQWRNTSEDLNSTIIKKINNYCK